MIVQRRRLMTVLTKLPRKWSPLLATAAVGLALVIAGCGGSSSATSPSRAKAPATSSPTTGIAQHNGGDQDADNNGGPNDGDGGL
jgi:hypothetical protein